LKIWDITEILAKKVSVPCYESNEQYFPDRKEMLNVGSYRHLIFEESRRTKIPDSKQSPIVREVKAHKFPCTHVTGHKLSGIITCSQAGHEIKVWDPSTLDLWLIISQLQTLPYELATHPNPYVEQLTTASVDNIKSVAKKLSVPIPD